MSDDFTINDRFKELRLALELSQEQFGAPIGLTKSSVSNIEKHIRNLNERIVMLLETKFRANPSWLHTGRGEMFLDVSGDFVAEMAAKYQLNTFQQTLVRAVYEMPPELQAMVIAVAKQLAAEDAARVVQEETEHERIERVANDYLEAHEAQSLQQQTDKRA